MAKELKYKEKEDLFHYPPCIVPAWEPLIDEIIELVEEWNDTEPESRALRIFQMKEKFGMFVVYLEPVNGSGVAMVPDSIRNAVNDIANEGINGSISGRGEDLDELLRFIKN